ncbi:MAG: phage regulatory CII family protein [Desulfobaccales bacterium]
MSYQHFVPQRKVLVKQWLRKALESGKVSTEFIAHQCGISDSLLSRQLNPEDPERYFHLHNLPIMVHETGDFTPLDQVEAVLGRVGFFMPPGQTGADQQHAAAEVLHKVGGLVAALGQVDRFGIECLGKEAIRAICTLMAAVA